MTSLILFGSFFLLIFLSVPIAVGLILSTIITIALTNGIDNLPLILIPSKIYSSTENFSLLAIPFFILAGNIMVVGGIAQRLVRFFNSFAKRISGGLAHVSVLSCMFFAALSGSSTATAAAIGKALIPEMTRYKYDPGFAASVVATGGIIGFLIPPSISMVVYGMVAEVSISKLFVGGIVPGVLTGLGVMIISWYVSRKKEYLGSNEKINLKEIWQTFRDAFWAITMPVIVLGAIYFGICTPTEAAAVSIFYGYFIGAVIYKEIKLKQLIQALKASLVESAVICFLMASATLFGWYLVNEQIPQKLASLLLSFSSSKIVIMLLIDVVYLIAGCFANPSAAIVLLVPILLPVINQLGIDLIYFGIFTVFVVGIGVITPPVGPDLFVVTPIANVPFERVVRSVLPFIVMMVILSVIFIFIPGILTFPIELLF